MSQICYGQVFYKPIPDPYEFQGTHHFKINKLDSAVYLEATMNSIRPVANVAAFTVPGAILMTGAGISYQHLKYIDSTSKWYCVWSISAMGWAGTQVISSTGQYATISYGISLGLLNNLIMIGPALNNGRIIGVIALGISLNN